MMKTAYTDDDIMSMGKVTPQVASYYLGIPVRNIHEGLQGNVIPVGYAYKKNEWVYVIFPERLVKYKHGYDLVAGW